MSGHRYVTVLWQCIVFENSSRQRRCLSMKGNAIIGEQRDVVRLWKSDRCRRRNACAGWLTCLSKKAAGSLMAPMSTSGYWLKIPVSASNRIWRTTPEYALTASLPSHDRCFLGCVTWLPGWAYSIPFAKLLCLTAGVSCWCLPASSSTSH